MADEAEREDRPSGSPKAPARLPYAPPEIREEPLEERPHLVSACAQHTGQDDVCNASPTS